MQRWEALQAQAVERQRQSSQVRELQRQVKTLRLSLEALGQHASELTKADDIDNRVKLIQKLQEAKVRLWVLVGERERERERKRGREGERREERGERREMLGGEAYEEVFELMRRSRKFSKGVRQRREKG